MGVGPLMLFNVEGLTMDTVLVHTDNTIDTKDVACCMLYSYVPLSIQVLKRYRTAGWDLGERT